MLWLKIEQGERDIENPGQGYELGAEFLHLNLEFKFLNLVVIFPYVPP